jgi:hypothetical protein
MEIAPDSCRDATAKQLNDRLDKIEKDLEHISRMIELLLTIQSVDRALKKKQATQAVAVMQESMKIILDSRDQKEL